jgi:hypothetical protein
MSRRSNWTPEQDKTLRDMLAERRDKHDIAEALGLSIYQVSGRMKARSIRNAAVGDSAGAGPRACLRCRTEFYSEGKHNRLCPSCGAYAADAAPMLVGMRA